MIYDLQKAGIWKRISAAILDGILTLVLVTFGMLLFARIFGYDTHVSAMNDIYDKYAAEYNISFDLTSEQMAALSEEEQAIYEAAANAMNADEEAIYVYNMVINLSLLILSLSILAAHLILEFAVPLLFKNGQTVGKKIFGLAVMRTDGVKVRHFAVFVRAILGKCVIETMIPVFMLFMMLMGSIGMVGPLVLLGIAGIQLCLLIFNQYRACIHDLLAVTVVVDIASQMIFDSPEDLVAYQQRIAAEKAERADY